MKAFIYWLSCTLHGWQFQWDRGKRDGYQPKSWRLPLKGKKWTN